jgi:hypothetical protein
MQPDERPEDPRPPAPPSPGKIRVLLRVQSLSYPRSPIDSRAVSRTRQEGFA